MLYFNTSHFDKFILSCDRLAKQKDTVSALRNQMQQRDQMRQELGTQLQEMLRKHFENSSRIVHRLTGLSNASGY